MKKYWYDRPCFLEFEDGTTEVTHLLTKRLTDLGVLIHVSGPKAYLTTSFTEVPEFPLVKIFEVDSKYKKSIPFDFNNFKE